MSDCLVEDYLPADVIVPAGVLRKVLALSVTCEDHETIRILRLEGDLDIRHSEELKSVLVESVTSKNNLEIDLTSATSIDITGIQLLLATARALAKKDSSFAISNIPENIRTAIRECGMCDFLLQCIPCSSPANEAGPENA